MRTEELKLFLYWITERHKIYLKKESGKKFPWTKDPILREYKFTNPFRQNDAVTKELGIRQWKNDNDETAFKKIIIFRMFNWPHTYDVLNSHGLIANWNTNQAINMLTNRKKNGSKIFTGAYVITNGGLKDPKINLVCKAIDKLLFHSKHIIMNMRHGISLEFSVTILCDYDMVGPFIAYELVTDLRHTKILNKATDIYTWANPGPGAKRGTHRILFGTERGALPKKTKVDYQVFMQDLMNLTQKKLGKKSIFKGAMFEMRDIEHSLCEFDKYMRVKNGEGRPRGKYRHE